ncbi:MAG: hypothetical protein II499_02715 [Firmicutes bacterium]|nr:hypothetical protein [Bacillota bacterium]
MKLLSAAIMARIAAGGNGSGNSDTKYIAVTGATPSIAAVKDACYVCESTVTALTISSIPEEGIFEIIFKAGSTAPQITGPACIVYREYDEVTASKMNEVSYNCFKIGNTQYAQGMICPFDEPAAS